MVAAADDEVVVFSIVGREADVFARIGLAIDKAIFDAIPRNADGDAVGSVIFQLGNDAKFWERDTGCFDSVLASNGFTV